MDSDLYPDLTGLTLCLFWNVIAVSANWIKGGGLTSFLCLSVCLSFQLGQIVMDLDGLI